ncbi:hypothetical protein QUF58_06780 [Anaerolineales bacterium HSG24]|nr:hypothetical protein [Anaerolineales bacterium HSG24]
MCYNRSLPPKFLGDMPFWKGLLLIVPYASRTYLILATILPIFLIAPLFYPGYIETHIGYIPLWNIADLKANIGNLFWQPHIVTNVSLFKSGGLLPYYIAALLPVSPLTGFKLVIALGWVSGSVGMFLWLKSWFGESGALIAALVYCYLPYQIATVYVRGAWSESFFLGLLPGVILVSTYLVTSPKWKLLPFAATGWLALGLTHLGLTMWALAFVTVLLIVVHPRQLFLPLISMLTGTFMATTISWLILTPTFTNNVIFADHLLYPFQLLSAHWGNGASLSGWADGLPFQLGMISVGLTILTVTMWQTQPVLPAEISRRDRRLIFFLIAGLFFIGLTLTVARPFWQLPITGTLSSLFLTYPWQLLGFSGLCFAVISGAALWVEPQLSHLPLLASLILMIVLGSYAYLEPTFIPTNQIPSAPAGIIGNNELLLLEPTFTVKTTGDTAGLNTGETTLPLVVHGDLVPQDTLYFNLIWQPLTNFEQNWKLFIHLVDSNDNVLAQFDGYPQFVKDPNTESYLTSQWIPGQQIADRYPLQLPSEMPPGPYRIYVGLYDETTFARLPVATDSNGRVILAVE